MCHLGLLIVWTIMGYLCEGRAYQTPCVVCFANYYGMFVWRSCVSDTLCRLLCEWVFGERREYGPCTDHAALVFMTRKPKWPNLFLSPCLRQSRVTHKYLSDRILCFSSMSWTAQRDSQIWTLCFHKMLSLKI